MFKKTKQLFKNIKFLANADLEGIRHDDCKEVRIINQRLKDHDGYINEVFGLVSDTNNEVDALFESTYYQRCVNEAFAKSDAKFEECLKKVQESE